MKTNVLIIVVVSVTICCLVPFSALAGCRFRRALSSTDDKNHHIVHRLNGAPWTVTIIDDGHVQVKNKKTSHSCEFAADQISSVFFGTQDVIVLEGGNAVQDYIYFIDGRLCKETEKKYVDLGADEKTRKKIFTDLKICEQ